MECPRLLPLAACLLLIAPLSLAQGPSDRDRLAGLWDRYQEAIDRGDHTNEGFAGRWAERFSQALEQTGGGGELRLRLLGELGSLHREAGDGPAAWQAWDRQHALAIAQDDPTAEYEALADLWSLAKQQFTDRQDAVIKRIDEAWARLQQRLRTPRRLISYFADLYTDIGRTLMARADPPQGRAIGDQDENAPARRELLRRAAARLAQVLDFPVPGATDPVHLHFRLGRIHAALGNADEAHGHFQAILDDAEQTEYAPMRIAHLDALARFDPRSAAYVAAMERILQEREPDSYELPLKQALAFAYLHTDEHPKAIEMLEQIVGQADQDAVNAHNQSVLAMAYQAVGEEDRARELYFDVIEQFPQTPAAQLARQRLNQMQER